MTLRVLILHAYSRQNAGDGLLVDLTAKLAEAAWGPEITLRTVALDAASFSGMAGVRPLLATPGSGVRLALPGLRLLIGRGADAQALRHDVEWADVILGVGGGYLRAGRARERLATGLVHLPQLRAAAKASVPVVYLPQSVGPLRGFVGRQIRSSLARVTTVFLRDDRSVSELGELASFSVRMPDLAVLELGEQLGRRVEGGWSEAGDVGIVGRDLAGGGGYRRRLMALAETLGAPKWLVQSRGRGNDDAAFYRRLGVTASGDLLPTLSAGRLGCVVSVRLHGALQSLLGGVPAVHLSYERKGFGAFEDLGLGRWVHNCRSFEPAVVARQATGLARESGPYWQSTQSAVHRLTERLESLVSHLRDLVDSDGFARRGADTTE